MQIVIDFKDESIAKKVLWFLNNLQDKGVKIKNYPQSLKHTNDNDFKNLQIDSMTKTWDNDFDKGWDEL
jgi:hypothetical protein